eukprot:2099806-Amphidinium_carterae.1
MESNLPTSKMDVFKVEVLCHLTLNRGFHPPLQLLSTCLCLLCWSAVRGMLPLSFDRTRPLSLTSSACNASMAAYCGRVKPLLYSPVWSWLQCSPSRLCTLATPMHSLRGH